MATDLRLVACCFLQQYLRAHPCTAVEQEITAEQLLVCRVAGESNASEIQDYSDPLYN